MMWPDVSPREILDDVARRKPTSTAVIPETQVHMRGMMPDVPVPLSAGKEGMR